MTVGEGRGSSCGRGVCAGICWPGTEGSSAGRRYTPDSSTHDHTAGRSPETAETRETVSNLNFEAIVQAVLVLTILNEPSALPVSSVPMQVETVTKILNSGKNLKTNASHAKNCSSCSGHTRLQKRVSPIGS